MTGGDAGPSPGAGPGAGAPVPPLGVGVVGASPDRGWALDAHLPAVAGLAEYRLAAVATTRPETARRAAEVFGAAAAYTDPAALAADPAVDLVVVCVKVPAHAEVVERALRAGKHVYCEWPLGLTTAEAERLAALAGERGVRHAVGLQARSSPLLATLRAALADGLLGTVLSCTAYSPTGSGGPHRDLARRYTADRANAAHTLTINTGHTLDTLGWLLGPLDCFDARVAVRQPAATVTETGEELAVTAPDQVVVSATTGDGCVVSVHAHSGARPNGTHFAARFHGTRGDLVLRSTGVRGLQIEDLSARFCPAGSTRWRAVRTDPRHYRVPEPLRAQPVLNVAQALRRLAVAIRGGTRFEPDFGTAVALHRRLDAVERAAATGRRQCAGARTGGTPGPGGNRGPGGTSGTGGSSGPRDLSDPAGVAGAA